MQEVTVMPVTEFRQVVEQLQGAVQQLTGSKGKSEKQYLTNEEFMALMGVSKRTAQTWRDEGIVAFSQVGSKIYYAMTDITTLMQEHRREQFDDNKKRR